MTKLKRDGTGLVYSTYLGGEDPDGPDLGRAIAVDKDGEAYVTGFTYSKHFPTKNPYQSMNRGVSNAYVTELNSNGSALVYSTYLGGTNYDVGEGIVVDKDGEAYVTGYTYSTDFPTKNAYQPTNRGTVNAFVTELKSNGTDLVYSTYLGGSSFDAGGAIYVDRSSNAYVTGDTYSPDFPTTSGAFQTTFGGGASDAFVTKLNSSGRALVYSTFLGGESDDHGHDITVDSAGQAHVTGFTNSMMFPTTPNAFQSTNHGDLGPPPFFYGDAFMTKLNGGGSALIYSTYFGGDGRDLGLGIAVDRAGKVYVTGSTSPATDSDFPTTPGAFQTTFGGAGPPYFYGDAFVAKFDVPVGEVCHKGDGDGDSEEHSSGKNEHHHFHKKADCDDPGDNENDNVESDDDHGSHFQSSSFTSSTYAINDTSQAITIVGTGLHNGLPVTFTMLAVNYGDVAPGVFNLTLSDGYSFIGTIEDGTIDIQ